jgi:hypothetical protein
MTKVFSLYFPVSLTPEMPGAEKRREMV